MRATRSLIMAALLVLGLGAIAPAAQAAWPHDPLVNVPLCTATGSQTEQTAVPDGGAPAGGGSGAIVTWQDYRSGALDIYAQRVLATGIPDPAWPTDGLAVCTAGGSQQSPTIAADAGAPAGGGSGAIVAWYDYRNGNYDIYAQHVLASGVADPAWPANGLAVCTAAGDQQAPVVVGDGSGNVIMFWPDYRSGAPDVYAQRVLASGAVDPAWPAAGLAVCTAGQTQRRTVAVADGTGGAIVAWEDYRNGIYLDIYAHHVLGSGVVDPAWTADGVALSTNPYDQSYPAIASDGAGGALVTWADLSNASDADIFAQRVLASGVADPAWTAGGIAVCMAASTQANPRLVPDGSGGALITWQDGRAGDSDIYAQRVLPAGTVDPTWPTDGIAVCTALGYQYSPVIVADETGSGAIVAWQDHRASAAHIYAQRILTTGAVDAFWPTDGRALSAAAGNQFVPVAVADGAGGLIAVWQDYRAGNPDLYAQRVERFGRLGNPEPVIVSVADVLNDQGGSVAVEWTASYLDAGPSYEIAQYTIWRRVPTAVAVTALGSGARLLALGAATPALPGRTIRVVPQGTETVYWEYVATQPARAFPGYSYLAATTCDSLPESNPYTSFLVLAETAGVIPYWASSPDSGYSVDDLAPAAPLAFGGQYVSGTSTLWWDANTEDDLAGYRLYRGHSAAFVPGSENLVAETAGTSFVDDFGAPCWYKLAAVDVHGNVSSHVTLLPAGTVDVPGAAPPRALALAPPEPNPARGGSTLRFALPRDARVSLGIHDAAGRRVRRLVDGPVAAGEHAIAWDGRDDAGAAVASGLYFCRLEAEGRVLTARLTTVR